MEFGDYDAGNTKDQHLGPLRIVINGHGIMESENLCLLIMRWYVATRNIILVFNQPIVKTLLLLSFPSPRQSCSMATSCLLRDLFTKSPFTYSCFLSHGCKWRWRFQLQWHFRCRVCNCWKRSASSNGQVLVFWSVIVHKHVVYWCLKIVKNRLIEYQ